MNTLKIRVVKDSLEYYHVFTNSGKLLQKEKGNESGELY